MYRALHEQRVEPGAAEQDEGHGGDAQGDSYPGGQSSGSAEGEAVVAKLRKQRLAKAALALAEGVEDNSSFCDFPRERQRHLRTNNPLERLMKEIRRRTRVVGAFPDTDGALMLASARLRHVAGTKSGEKRYMAMDRRKWNQKAAQH
ncbi:MAG: transposase [Verrucomicrobiota bacterium]